MGHAGQPGPAAADPGGLCTPRRTAYAGHVPGAAADHANYPSGVCCHPDPRMDPYDQGATVASVLMDLGTQQMWLADGNPCTAPYRELDYRGFLAKPSPVAADRWR